MLSTSVQTGSTNTDVLPEKKKYEKKKILRMSKITVDSICVLLLQLRVGELRFYRVEV